MSKTKLLLEIETQSKTLGASINTLATQLDTAPDITVDHWKLFTRIGSELTTLSQTIHKMKTKIDSWDGSPKLKNKFKDQKKLADARAEAKKKFAVLEADYRDLEAQHKLWMSIMVEFGHG